MTNAMQSINVLFLCSHNSARSILAEAILNAIGAGRFKAYSAGCSLRENEMPDPQALQALRSVGIPVDGLYSKTWEVFSGPDAPRMDLIITVCDNAAEEECPVWPGHPATAHWGYAELEGKDASDHVKLEEFRKTLYAIKRRLELLCSLPDEKLHQAVLQSSARQLATAVL